MEAIRSNGLNNFRHNQPADYDLDPRNLLAINMVRCMNCSKYFPLNQIHDHLKIHERVLGYEQPHIFNNDRQQPYSLAGQRPKIDKLQFDDGVTSQTRSIVSGHSYRNNFDIHTMKPEELPTTDNLRRAIPKPSLIDVVHGGTERVSQPQRKFIMVDETTTVPGDHISAALEIPQVGALRQVPRVDDYYEPIKLNKISLQIVPKPINIYSNHTQIDMDTHVEQRKNLKLEYEPSKGNYWTAERGPDEMSDTKTNIGGSEQQPSNSRKFAVSDNGKIDVHQQPARISTKSKSGIGMTNKFGQITQSRIIEPSSSGHRHGATNLPKCSWICGGDSTVVGPANEASANRSDFSCPACGGFYCPVCKSTIPPQFRPPPGMKQYLEHSKQMHISARTGLHE